MRYIKRILLILFLVIMISGCSVDYKIKINKDLSINDKVLVSEKTDRMKSRTDLDVNQSVKYLYDIYKFNGMGSDEYTILSSNITTKVSSSNSYKDFDEFVSKFHCDITDQPIYIKSKDTVYFEIDQLKEINSKASTRPVYDLISFTIEVPFKVINNNADKVNGNEYTWYIKADDEYLKRIIIEFKPDKVEKTVSFGLGDEVFHIGYEYIGIIILIVLVGIAILFVYLKNRKNNKI